MVKGEGLRVKGLLWLRVNFDYNLLECIDITPSFFYFSDLVASGKLLLCLLGIESLLNSMQPQS